MMQNEQKQKNVIKTKPPFGKEHPNGGFSMYFIEPIVLSAAAAKTAYHWVRRR